jgi:hypothetical protein
MEQGSQRSRCRRGIADHPGSAQLRGEPGAGGLALQAPARGNRHALDAVGSWVRPGEIRGQMQHQRGLRQAGVQTLAAFRLRDQLCHPFRSTPEEAGQHRQPRLGGAQLPCGHFQQSDLTTVGVEQHQPFETGPSQIPAHGAHQINQQLGWQAEGAGEALVLRREAQALKGQAPDRQLRWQPLQNIVGDPIGEQGIGAERQVRTVLFDRPEGPDHSAPRPVGRGGQRRPAEPLKATPLPPGGAGAAWGW